MTVKRNVLLLFYVLLYFSPAAGFTTFSAYYAVASMRALTFRRAAAKYTREKRRARSLCSYICHALFFIRNNCSAHHMSTETEPTLTHPFFISGVASSLLMLSGETTSLLAHFFNIKNKMSFGRAIQFSLEARLNYTRGKEIFIFNNSMNSILSLKIPITIN